MDRTKTNRPFRVMTHDPSTRGWGWAVLDSTGHVLIAGCIKTQPEHKKRRIRKGDDYARRVGEINLEIKKVVDAYRINYMLVELPHGSQNANGAKMIGMVTGICQTISVWENIGIEWYSEGDGKKAVLGKLTGTKQEMIAAIGKLYKVPWTNVGFRDEAIADALAIHYAASQQSEILKFWIYESRNN